METEGMHKAVEPGAGDRFAAQLEAMRRRLAELEGIEERCRRAETALHALEERNRLLGDAAPMGLLAADEQGRVMAINGKMLEPLSLPRLEDVRSINILRIPELVNSGIAGRIRCCLAKRETVICDHPLPLLQTAGKDGRWQP